MPQGVVRILDATQVASLLDIGKLLSVIETALEKQGRSEVVRPERPHFPVGEGLDPDRPDETLETGLTMPACVHGSDYYTTKLVGFFEGTTRRATCRRSPPRSSSTKPTPASPWR